MPKLAHELRMLNPIVNFESYKGTRILVSLNLEEFGLQNQQSLDGKRFYMDPGESHRVQLPLNSGCDRFTHRGTAVRFGHRID